MSMNFHHLYSAPKISSQYDLFILDSDVIGLYIFTMGLNWLENESCFPLVIACWSSGWQPPSFEKLPHYALSKKRFFSHGSPSFN